MEFGLSVNDDIPNEIIMGQDTSFGHGDNIRSGFVTVMCV